MKTLIHIIPTLQNGGAETVLTRLVEEWHKKGVQQYVITIQGRSSDHNHNVVSKFSTVIHVQEYPMKQIDCLQKNPNAKILAWMYKGIHYAYKWKKTSQGEQEIIWNIRRSYFSAFEWKQKLALFIFGLFSRYKKSRIIYCANIAEKAHIPFGFYRSNSKVIGNRLAKKINMASISNVKLPNQFFLYVGRLNHAKGPDRLLRVFDAFNKNNENISLVIAGRGWEKINLPSRLLNKVKLIGDVPHLDFLYQKAITLLFTSYTEGYPNVVVEAIAQGTPVVGFEAGDSRSILADYPFGHTVETEGEFLNKLQDLLDALPTKEERLKEASRQQKRLDFSLTVKEYEQFIWNN